MGEETTIQISKSLVRELKSIKKYPRQTYEEIILELIKALKHRSQYDEFIHKIQQQKMRELWDNKEDEAWEDA